MVGLNCLVLLHCWAVASSADAIFAQRADRLLGVTPSMRVCLESSYSLDFSAWIVHA